eukprot:TRINITY_DN6160_c0_g1_i2.p2 TRINITY_DN6160_c0_g1~~TRINITY_DN6160_c0_g1_i2.p2  ORF type:complete len:425 (+),score=132.01 TRINITY_DN6160_c0_g1_i2:395-1669(+)
MPFLLGKCKSSGFDYLEEGEGEEELTIGEPVGFQEGVVVRNGDEADANALTDLVQRKLDPKVGEPIVLEQNVKVTIDVDSPSLFGLKGLPPDLQTDLLAKGFSRKDIESSLTDIYNAYKTRQQQLNPPPMFSADPDVTVQRFPLSELLTPGDPAKLFSRVKKLDGGSQGDVFRAYNEMGKPVALKKIFIKNEKRELPAVENEVSMLKCCTHPNIIDYYACHRKENTLWIAMELMNGGKLTDVIDSGYKFNENEIAFVMHEVLKGLHYLHKTKRMHRDIKSDNILISTQGTIKLGDFGFCAMIATKRRTVVGTPYWMAPEVIKGLPYDYAADMWSYGILGLELCDGQPPLMNLPPKQALSYIAQHEAPKLKTRTKWSLECINFMESALVIKPNDRPTAEQLMGHPFLRRAERADPGFIKRALLKH